MTTSPNILANNLKDAYRVCDVVPLQDEELERYYVDLSEKRKTNAINEISLVLEDQELGDSGAILFTGHRGCGKSTELRQIQKQWEDAYQVIYIDAMIETDINNAEYTDIYLIVIKWVEFELRRNGLKFDAKLLSSFEEWFKEIITETVESVEKSISMEGEVTLSAENSFAGIKVPLLAKILVNLLAKGKASHEGKKTVRQTLLNDISRLKSDINLLLDDGLKKWRNKFPKCKGFLIVFDNLDRCPLEVANHLFFDYAAQLKDLHCTIVYTVPISVVYSPKNINNAFANYHIIPMINIYNYDPLDRSDKEPEYNDDGLNAVVSLIEKRVDVDAIFESQQGLLELAKYSGGHVRQMMQIVRGAIQNARTRRADKVSDEHINYAINQEQFNFERVIPTEHYPVLLQVYLNKNIPKNETGQLMLSNISVLEYNGMNRWNYLNPVIIRSRLFQRELEDYRAKNP
jgi:energy-coupling factor transporter ATP-binding protein EcfA2